jgi:hypothetical protein
MKKTMMILFAVTIVTYANAQIKTNAGTFSKPTAGTLLSEVTFMPNLSGSAMFAFSDLNKNLTSGVADGQLPGVKFRKFSSESRAVRYSANLTIANSGEEESSTSYLVGFSYGVENHTKGSERLSTYWGYEATAGLAGTSGTTMYAVGGNVLSGFDYYTMPNLYIGAEISYGISVINTKNDGFSGTTAFKLAPGITPSLRLGWKF